MLVPRIETLIALDCCDEEAACDRPAGILSPYYMRVIGGLVVMESRGIGDFAVGSVCGGAEDFVCIGKRRGSLLELGCRSGHLGDVKGTSKGKGAA